MLSEEDAGHVAECLDDAVWFVESLASRLGKDRDNDRSDEIEWLESRGVMYRNAATMARGLASQLSTSPDDRTDG